MTREFEDEAEWLRLLARGPHGAEPAWVRDPRDGRHEWRRLFSEAFGTFLLVAVAAGGPVVDAVSGARSPSPPRWWLPA